MVFQKEWIRKWFAIPLLLFVAALAYLPSIGNFGYFRDDWYLMYAANAAGPGVFQDIFAIDRPARAPVMSAMYSLFGLNPLYYNISAYVFRILGALAFLWLLRMLWPRQRSATTITAILFVIYPGFLSMPNAIDYQSHLSGLAAGMLSIALTIRALTTKGTLARVFLFFGSVLLGFFYLSQIEWYFGLEVLRLAAVALLISRKSGLSIWQWLGQTLYRWSPFALAPLGFIVWRFFIFQSERKATDLAAQVSQFQAAPLLISIQWIRILLQDAFEVLLLAWGVPLTNLWYMSLRLRELTLAGFLVVLGLAAVLLVSRFEGEETAQDSDEPLWWKEAFWLGLVSMVSALIPVIVSNREANLDNLSRYTLAGSAGAVIVLVALIDQFRSRNVRLLTTCVLVSIAVLTHYFNGIQWARSSAGMREFWWQVSWRIPQLQPGTTLVANYSQTSIEEDYFVWGPANLIYYPQSTDAQHLRPALWSLVLSRENVIAIQTGAEPVAINRRSILTFMDYDHVLILTQPTPDSCVQVIDGNQPLLSESEQYDIQMIAAASDQSRILLDEQAGVPPRSAFGPEPQQSWCYFYEKAALAYQRGDWETVLDLGREATRQGFSASDPVEWMPFLQAAALLGDRDEMLALAPKVKKSPFLASQACRVLSTLPELEETSRALVQKNFCETLE